MKSYANLGRKEKLYLCDKNLGRTTPQKQVVVIGEWRYQSLKNSTLESNTSHVGLP